MWVSDGEVRGHGSWRARALPGMWERSQTKGLMLSRWVWRQQGEKKRRGWVSVRRGFVVLVLVALALRGEKRLRAAG